MKKYIIYIISGGFILLLICIIGSFISVKLIQSGSSIDSVNRAALSVCTGSGVADAASYSAGESGLHSIIIIIQHSDGYPIYISNWEFNLNSNYFAVSKDHYPNGWFPKSTNELQLVACIMEDTSLKEQCEYKDEYGNYAPIRNRVQEVMTVDVFEAKTRKLVKKFSINGGLPEDCPFKTYSKGNIFGSPVKYDAILKELFKIEE